MFCLHCQGSRLWQFTESLSLLSAAPFTLACAVLSDNTYGQQNKSKTAPRVTDALLMITIIIKKVKQCLQKLLINIIFRTEKINMRKYLLGNSIKPFWTVPAANKFVNGFWLGYVVNHWKKVNSFQINYISHSGKRGRLPDHLTLRLLCIVYPINCAYEFLMQAVCTVSGEWKGGIPCCVFLYRRNHISRNKQEVQRTEQWTKGSLKLNYPFRKVKDLFTFNKGSKYHTCTGHVNKHWLSPEWDNGRQITPSGAK